MARRQRDRGRGNRAAANRNARVGALVRQILAEELDALDDERLSMVSITSVDVDRELYRAVVWFTTLDGDDNPAIAEAFAQHAGRLRREVSRQSRLRHTPILDFRPDVVLRSAERIEDLLRADESDEAGDSNDGDAR